MSDAIAIPANMKRKRRTSSFGESAQEQNKSAATPHTDYKTAKKEKKRGKSEAKKARKLNDLEHRKARRNPEKYNKNKERNRILAIEAERHIIRSAAVKQCGGAKAFGTGEKETSAKPSHPEGFTLADGEQDWLALWDLNDEGVWKRIQDRERKEKKLKKEDRRKEREAAKIRKAEKRAKKAKTVADSLTASTTGAVDVDMKDSADPKSKGAQEMTITKVEEPKNKSKKIARPESESESESSSESEESEVEEIVKSVVVESNKSKKGLETKAQEAAPPAPKVEEAKMKKKSKIVKDEVPAEDQKERLKREKRERKREKKAAAEVPVEAETQQNKAEEEIKSKKEKSKKEKKSKKGSDDKSESKKRKRSNNEAEAEFEVPEPAEKFTNKSEVGVSNGAEQWNPDALSGDAARKNKFLRLLGARKGGASNDVAASKKPNMATGAGAIDLNKIERELEMQFITGVKMKHDGGGKRRGLGA